jgi:hypothetical protein
MKLIKSLIILLILLFAIPEQSFGQRRYNRRLALRNKPSTTTSITMRLTVIKKPTPAPATGTTEIILFSRWPNATGL